jgi:hypothetical protein
MNIETLLIQAVSYDKLASYFNSRFGMVGYRDQAGYAYLEEQIAACKAESKRLCELVTAALLAE